MDKLTKTNKTNNIYQTNKILDINSLNKKLNKIISNQKIIIENENKILGEEFKLETLENQELLKEDLNQKTEEDVFHELIKLESNLKKKLFSPINKITNRDLFKGFIGAFLGIMGHFAFYKGSEIAQTLTIFMSTILYLIAFLIIIIMLYYTGFRKVQKHIILKFMPIRALILYCVSIFVILLVNLLFGKIHFPISFIEIYKLVGSSIILAVLGAGTADLIGGNAE